MSPWWFRWPFMLRRTHERVVEAWRRVADAGYAGFPPWPRKVEDEVDRDLRYVAEYLKDHWGKVKAGHALEGQVFEWDTPQARDWVMARLEEKLYG